MKRKSKLYNTMSEFEFELVRRNYADAKRTIRRHRKAFRAIIREVESDRYRDQVLADIRGLAIEALKEKP